ncbi:MAG: flagellar basal-body rod protein FlgG [bacterium]|nr:MAG: flagellar basal-body rod protein FlgG [bacterium]
MVGEVDSTMIFSIYTGISGMRVNADRIRVTANNIANVNTPGFRSGRAVIQSSASGGAKTAAVQRSSLQGAAIFTANPFNIAIEGAGFFRLTTTDGRTGYSRLGNFSTDNQGRLADPAGNVLIPGITIPADAQSISIGRDGRVTATLNGQSGQIGQKTLLGIIETARFNNPSGLIAGDGGVFFESAPSGAPITGAPGSGGRGALMPGSIESSNVDLTKEIVDLIITKHAYAANAKTVKTADELLGIALDIKT